MPGALSYVFEPSITADDIVERLCANQWRGQIVGPHGSGKSTLLSTLMPHWHSAGRHPLLITLHDGQRRLPASWKHAAHACGERPLIIVDGYEQLSAWSRWRLQATCRWRGWGLLVTTHQSLDLPTVFRTKTTVSLTESLLEDLTMQHEFSLDRPTVDAMFRAHDGNLRDLFFDAFDRYERHRDDVLHNGVLHDGVLHDGPASPSRREIRTIA